MDFHQHGVSVGSLHTACVVSQILKAHHQVEVVSSSGWPGTTELVVSGCHILSERLNTIFLNASIKGYFVTWQTTAAVWERPDAF